MSHSNSDKSPDRHRPLTLVLGEPGREPDADWLDALQRDVGGQIRIARGGPAAAGSEIETLPDCRGPWWQWLARALAGHEGSVLIFAAGLELPERFGERVEHLLQAPALPPLLTFPGNHEAPLDPAGGLEGPPAATVDSIINAAAGLWWTAVRYRPRRLALIPPGRIAEALEAVERHQCWLYDGLWIRDPLADADLGGPDQPDLRTALGPLRETLQRLGPDSVERRLPLFGFDARPVTLHISHDWGGGVARWIDDLAAADSAGNHLVLSAGGRTDGDVHGQHLRLYAAGPGRACVREWTLSPSIAGTARTHAHYRAVLDGVIERYGIARVFVSSLIGHGLEALATPRPTLQMLHDYYPAWPVLDRDPLQWLDDDGVFDLDAAIAATSDSFLFAERDGAAWRQLAGAWLERVRAQGVALAAPTGQVLERWRKLVDDSLDDAAVVAHGFSGWPDDSPSVAPRALPDGRLNLVVVGRLSPGKGLKMLESALPRLRRHARVTLLGCGHHGMRFFGRGDVDIILDYDHHQLPRHLARIGAQAVLFLSTVAETWNYVLSETRSLGLVPVATRTGSFIERIEHDRDGVLFEPRADALVECIRRLREQPDHLEALRERLPDEPGVADALSRLDGLVSSDARRPRAPGESGLERLASGDRAGRLAEARSRNLALTRRAETLAGEVDERTDWARRQERLADERLQWARRLEAHGEREREAFRQRTAQLEGAIETRERELESLHQEIGMAHERIDHLDGELKAIRASRSWRLTRPMRVVSRLADNAARRRVWNPRRWPRLVRRLFDSLRLHGARGTLEVMQQGAHGAAEPPTEVATAVPDESHRPEPVTLPRADEPLASIVVPVFNKVHFTAACLGSIAQHPGNVPFEVIVVDDHSDDETPDYLAECRGLTVLRNEHNSGFIASCNNGARAASGRYLVFLNNDTTVTAGWLEHLLETFERFPNAGLAGARLVYPDGRLQEAGGIIFSDGSGWNYGRGERPDRPEFNFACQADYVSGACLAIERERFWQLDGFDRHYAPAYYEDTDLCFRVREQGLEVIYQPGCTIVHHEGVSSGTDESSGTKRYQAINREKFVARWRDRLDRQPAPVSGPEAVAQLRRARHHRCRGNVLVVDAVTPEPDKDSGSVRMVAMLTILRELGFRVSFMPENLAWAGGYTTELQRRGIEMLHHPWVDRAGDWLDAFGPTLDLVIASRHYVLEPLLEPIRQSCPAAAVVFDTVDLHFLREQRMAELGGDERVARTARRTRQAELELIRQSDATLVVSPVERELLRELEPRSRIHVLSNIHQLHGSECAWARRRDLMFVGGFQHPPNVDAAQWLIESIMPRVRAAIADVKLHIIGSRMPDSLLEQRADGVVIHGYVPDLRPYLQTCRLSVAPLRYGAGVKGKVNQAMAWGLPVVATSCAAEGMFLTDGEDVLIADTAEDFAAAVVRAYNDEALWQQLSRGGLANVEAHFSHAAARRAIGELLEALAIRPRE